MLPQWVARHLGIIATNSPENIGIKGKNLVLTR